MTAFDAAPVLAGLTGFQRRSVDHVVERFYGPNEARRFLVADETGLGKSLVAKGVIARTVEILQDRPGQGSIDVVYVCSNSDIARQNLEKLDVVHGRVRPSVGRLTLLAKHSSALEREQEVSGHAVNLVSFTPGTSFALGRQTGMAEERALLFLMLQGHLTGGWERRSAVQVLRDNAGTASFETEVTRLDWELPDGPDPAVTSSFLQAADAQGLVEEFKQALADVGRRDAVPEPLRSGVRSLISRMRSVLARAGMQVLDPDLVVLDEFQRFRDLLDPTTVSGELAHQLFDYEQAKVLLLSATPYKPFTYAEEQDEDHHRDFLATLRFLSAGTGLADDIAADLRSYRDAAVTGQPVGELGRRLRARLLTVMSRHERPAGVLGGMHRELVAPLSDLSPHDLVGYVRLQELSEHVAGDVSLEYWKSTPYFANFCDGYKLSEKLRNAARGPQAASLAPFLTALPRLDRAALAAHEPVDLGNAKLRALAEQTVDAGWWQLLWLPPSLPYLHPEGPYAQPWARHMTKRLVFSSWAATPTAIAALLSQRADAHLRAVSTTSAGDNRRLLDYRMEGSRPGAMTTLALFWPMPDLARSADPLRSSSAQGGPVAGSHVEGAVVRNLRQGVEKWPVLPASSAAAVALAQPGSLPASWSGGLTRLVNALGSGNDEEPELGRGVRAHVEEALRLRSEPTEPAAMAGLAPTLAALAAHSPANAAWRALSRVASPTSTEGGLWEAAAVLATGLRSLFNRPDVLLLLAHLHERGAYWEKVLSYCADGNLQAVLDEHVHHLALASGMRDVDDAALLALARTTAATLSLRPSLYGAFDPARPDDAFRLSSRFALRYGGPQRDQESVRQPEVRQAFNSPFWPFVLASTSVGQEGIDFHWWCSSILHWNTPANPVDFEQREGRIDRYAGHAVRRNLAHRHGAEMLRSSDPWEAAYELGKDEQARLGEFAPHWVYPGPAAIERHLSPYPLSTDIARLERLKTDVALYRLTFGQPRQEDMLELLRQRGVEAQPEQLAELRIDLSPP